VTNPVDDIQEVLFTEEQITQRVRDLAGAISRDYAGRAPLLVSVLKGAVYFLTDLSRALAVPVEIDFMAITTYGGTKAQSGVVRLIKDLDVEITGRDVMLVEDIIDTGLTAGYLLRLLQARAPASLRICTLLDRPHRRILETLDIAYRGFDVPDRFLVGYGLDYRERYRHLPFIGVLKDEVLAVRAAAAALPET
jgi:hypoxanthine phosphoribosyltransferase